MRNPQVIGLPYRSCMTQQRTEDMDHQSVRAPTLSLILRIWADDVAEVRGEIERIGTGERQLFRHYPALLDLLASWSRELDTVTMLRGVRTPEDER
jgi:hypothetical protein